MKKLILIAALSFNVAASTDEYREFASECLAHSAAPDLSTLRTVTGQLAVMRGKTGEFAMTMTYVVPDTDNGSLSPIMAYVCEEYKGKMYRETSRSTTLPYIESIDAKPLAAMLKKYGSTNKFYNYNGGFDIWAEWEKAKAAKK